MCIWDMLQNIFLFFVYFYFHVLIDIGCSLSYTNPKPQNIVILCKRKQYFVWIIQEVNKGEVV